MEVTIITKRQKSSSSKVKSEDNACVFLRQQGNYSPRVCPWGTNCHWKFLFECSGTPIEEDSPCPAQVLITRQLVSSRQCTGSSGSCCARIFSPKTIVCAKSSALLPRFIPLWLFLVPQTEVTIERVPLWRCSRHPRSCDIDSSGHTTRRRAEVVPVFARSCHSLYRCRRDVLWIKYRYYSSLLFQFYSITSVSLYNCRTVYLLIL